MTGHIKRVLFFLISLIAVIDSFGQSANDSIKKIDPELLKQDFTIFRDSLERLHPGLYRYKSKNEMDKLFDSCFATLNHSMAIIKYYSVMSYLISAIEDGHISCHLPHEYVQPIIATAKMFPTVLRFIYNKGYVACNTKELPAGTEILSIDHQSINEIRKQLFHYLPSDGKIQSNKYWEMNNGDSPFPYLYYLVYGEKPDFKVTYKTKEGQIKTMTLIAEIVKNIQCLPQQPNNETYINLDFKQDHIAVLTIKTFRADLLQSSNRDFDQFLEKAFKQINGEKVKTLIIDLRDNSGGRDFYGSKLYSYLTDQPFKYYASLSSTTRKFTVEDHRNLAIQESNANNFKSKVYFLINGNSFSTTAEFCAIAKSNSRGIFIGEETGGGYYGNTSGARATFILPNTKISINIPLTKYVMAVKKAKYKDRGIIPDYTVIPGISDVIRNKDVQLNYAIHLAGSR